MKRTYRTFYYLFPFHRIFLILYYLLTCVSIQAHEVNQKVCSGVGVSDWNKPRLLTSSITVIIGAHQNVTCFGLSNGSATVTASGGSGPYSYYWGPGLSVFGPTAAGLSAGAYFVIVSDSTGTRDSAFVTITQPAKLNLTLVHQNVTCPGLNNGSASVSPSGGTPPYSFAWSTNPVQTTSSVSGLSPSTYSLSVSDSNACIHDTTLRIVQPGGYISPVAVGCTFRLTAIDSLGSGPYSWTWSTNPVQTTQSIIVSTSGTYSVTAMDTSFCLHTDTLTIQVPVPPPTPVISLVGASLVCNAAPPCLWYLMGVPISGITDSLLNPSVNGVYTVRNGVPPCVSFSAPFTLHSAGIASLPPNNLLFQVHPNPCSGRVELIFSGNSSLFFVVLHDLTGRELFRTKFDFSGSDIYPINLEFMAAGIYLLSVCDDTGKNLGQQKLVLQK